MDEQNAESLNDAIGIGQMQQLDRANSMYYNQEAEQGLSREQLECKKLLLRLRHILKQDLRKIDEKGKEMWKAIDTEKRILTDDGVEKIMQMVEVYVNKETLLSNFDEDLIYQRVWDEFASAFNGSLFMKSNFYFREPTIEEAIKVIKERIEEKVKIREGVMSILGIPFDKKKFNQEVLNEMEKVLGKEIENVREQKRLENQMDSEMLFLEVVHTVETAHQRAWKGEERGSLRRHTSINELIGRPMPQQSKGGFFGFLK
jgi:hypothetical protein